MAFKERLKKKRIEKNMTLEDLATKVGVSRQTIQRYESGVISNIPSDKIEIIADKLDTTPGFLMGWEESPEEKADILFDAIYDKHQLDLNKKYKQMNEKTKKRLLSYANYLLMEEKENGD